jgi:hypothetical protein
MSVRAYRVVEIKTGGESFNLWHDEKVVDWLENKTSFFNSLNEDGCGLTYLEVDNLKTMLSEIGSEMDEYARKAIKEDISFAEQQGDSYVQYYCY